jgi:hypothetical protein
MVQDCELSLGMKDRNSAHRQVAVIRQMSKRNRLEEKEVVNSDIEISSFGLNVALAKLSITLNQIII